MTAVFQWLSLSAGAGNARRSRMMTILAEPYRCLGRPMPPVVLEHPLTVELAAAPLVEAVLLRRPTVRVAGDATVEGPLLAGLAVTASRLRRNGLKVRVRGEVLDSIEPPARPDGAVAVLLEAPFYESLGEWAEPRSTQTAILVGHAAEWKRAGVAPDIELAPFSEIDLAAWRARWRSDALRGDKGALSAALACDLRVGAENLHSVHVASTERPTGWHSADVGLWLAREELVRLLREEPAFLERVRALAEEGPRHARSIALLEAQCRTGW